MPKADADSSALAGQLRRLVSILEASGRAFLPGSNRALLQSIVEAAARIFGAAAASIALVDEQEQALEFVVAYGVGNENVVGLRLGLDQGIAGYVVMTGQPMAISNVGQDVRFNQDVARSTGYVPNSILAMPLLLDDRVIGVMEVLDKIEAPSFGLQDMELLGLFARQAAIAIHESQEYARVGRTLLHSLRRAVAAAEGSPETDLLAALDEAAAGSDSHPEDLFALADIFQVISDLGAAERHTALRLLATFADYARSQPRLD